MKTQPTNTKNRKFSHFVLALALSIGTVGGMASFAAMTEPALAKSAGGGGNAGGGNAGGENGGVMAANANKPGIANIQQPNIQRSVPDPTPCGQSADGTDTIKCKYTQRPSPRVVRINGFANCAIVQQVRATDGRPAEFYCLRSM